VSCNKLAGVATWLVAACATTAALAPAAAGWGPPRTNGLGTQTLRGGTGADYLRGAEGPDTVRGNGGRDLLTGDTGPDHVYGGSGSDTLTGGAGIDLLSGGSGNDIAFGGFGADRIEGGPGDDALDGNNDNDTLSGGDGNDILHGGSGIDKLEGGPGDDRLFGDSGADFVDAGPGDDTIVVDGSSKARVGCGPGRDTLYLAVAADATSDYVGRGVGRQYGGCETVWLTDALVDPNKGLTYLAYDFGGKKQGSERDDTLLGGPGPDALYGGAGNDVLWGLRQPGVTSVARDILDAGSGDDTVYGGPGPQQIDGGPGDDFLEGGIGDGTIRGGSGDDTIRLRGGGLTKIDAGAGNDTIYARGTARGRITCGRGRDVAHVDAGDRAARDCERRVGRAARPAATSRATYADALAATPGLVHWWRLGERETLNVTPQLMDRIAGASGSYNGELGVPGVVDDGDTAYGSDAYFSRYSYLALGISDELLHGAFTFEGWFRSDDSGTKRVLLDDILGGNLEGVALVREAGNALHAVITSRADPDHRVDFRSGPLNLPTDSWHHIALTRADDRAAIYVDGAAVAQTPATPVLFDTTSYSVRVGNRFGDYLAWEGAIDEIAFYDRALDAATVSAHAHAGDDGLAPVARADPAPAPLQPRSGVIHLTADKAGSSFHCSLDGAPFVTCKAEYALEHVPDGDHELRVLATSRTGVTQAQPTLLRFRVDATLPGTLLALRLAPDGDGRAIVTFGWDGAVAFECRLRGSTEGVWLPCAPPLDLPPDTLFEVRSYDAAGNRDPNPAIVKTPRAGVGFGYGATLPTFAGGRAEAQLQGEGIFATYQCRVDGRIWATCAAELRLPILDPGTHTLQVRQQFRAGDVTTPPITWTVAPRPGDVAIAGLQMQLVIERSARLLRRAPRVRFALSHPAAVTVDVLSGTGKGRALIGVEARGSAGANLLKVSARRLNALREGRYTVRVTARGATGRTAVQQLPLAIVPPLR
jgi:Ca2+-binding RTX toxin-like protein